MDFGLVTLAVNTGIPASVAWRIGVIQTSAGIGTTNESADMLLCQPFEHGDGVSRRRETGWPEHINRHPFASRRVFGPLFDYLRKIIQAMQHVTKLYLALEFR